MCKLLLTTVGAVAFLAFPISCRAYAGMCEQPDMIRAMTKDARDWTNRVAANDPTMVGGFVRLENVTTLYETRPGPSATWAVACHQTLRFTDASTLAGTEFFWKDIQGTIHTKWVTDGES